jgi:hypothetical protein
MENLSIHKVLAEAPAAAHRRNANREGLIDTTDFLRRVRKLGFKPVLAVQGANHNDSEHAKPKNGRHLVIAARPSTAAIFLLNSHTKDRRAHLGLGWYRNDGFFIGASTPVQRWFGYEGVLDGLLTRDNDLLQIAKALKLWLPDEAEVKAMARGMSRRGYMASVAARPSVDSLVEGFNGNAKELCFEIIRRMRVGNLEAADRGRRIKGIRRPDGLFHAGMVAFDEIMKIAKARGHVPRSADFGDIEERLVRP